MVMINPLDVVLQQFNTDGVSVEVKRQRPDGLLEPTKPGELASLGTKSRLAHTANLLHKLSAEEKMEWALEMKDQANALYREKNFSDAMNTYVEALTASSFGSNDTTDNTDSLVVPVLCNLAACCIQLGEWTKAIQFSDQAIKLRAKCPKAHLRRAMACLKINEYEDALVSILSCQSNVEASSAPISTELECVVESSAGASASVSKESSIPSMELSEADKKKLPSLLYQARVGIKQNKERFEKQKAGLRKAFVSEKKADVPTVTTNKTVEVKSGGGGIVQLFLKFVLFLLETLLKFLKFVLRVPNTPQPNKNE